MFSRNIGFNTIPRVMMAGSHGDLQGVVRVFSGFSKVKTNVWSTKELLNMYTQEKVKMRNQESEESHLYKRHDPLLSSCT